MPVGYNYTIGDTVNLHVFKLKLLYNPDYWINTSIKETPL